MALESIFVAPGRTPDVVARAVAAGVPVFDLAPGVLERVADTVTPQPVLAVAVAVDVDLDALAGTTLLVVCVDVRDPGNLGTVLRSAEAAGVGGIICCDGCVDIYNPKCVRASAGSLFHTRIVARGDPVQVLGTVGGWGLRRLGTRAGGGAPYTGADLTAPTALVLGNEGHAGVEGIAQQGRAFDHECPLAVADRGPVHQLTEPLDPGGRESQPAGAGVHDAWRLSPASLTSPAKAAGSVTARSARTLRSTSTPASRRPEMNRL